MPRARKTPAIPHIVTIGQHRAVWFVEHFGPDETPVAGSGYLRAFGDPISAACWITALKRGGRLPVTIDGAWEAE